MIMTPPYIHSWESVVNAHGSMALSLARLARLGDDGESVPLPHNLPKLPVLFFLQLSNDSCPR